MSLESNDAVPRGSDGGQKRDSHVPALDGLRGLAIIMVLFVHFIGDAQPYYAVLFLLFFVLLLFPSLLPTGLAESSRHQGWVWSYGVNLFIAQRGEWALPYISHFWSLAVEEHFYLLWPVIVLAASRKSLLRICAGCALFSLALRIVLSLAGMNEISTQVLTPCRFDALCTGGFLAVASRSGARSTLIRSARPAALVLASAILALSALTATTHWLEGPSHALRSFLIALFFGALLLACVHAEPVGFIGRFFNHPAMRFFGKYSYGIYVYHGVIAYFLVDKRIEDDLAKPLGSHFLAVLVEADILPQLIELLFKIFFRGHRQYRDASARKF